MLFSHSEILKKKNDEIKSSLSEQTNFSVAKSLEIGLRSMIGIFTVRETWHLKTQCLLLFYQQNKQEYQDRILTICAISSSEFIASDNGRVTRDNRVLP